MLMKWTALVITFRPSAGEKAETAKQRLEQKSALLLSLCTQGSGGRNRTGRVCGEGVHVGVCARTGPPVHSQPPSRSAGAEVRGDGMQMTTDWGSVFSGGEDLCPLSAAGAS